MNVGYRGSAAAHSAASLLIFVWSRSFYSYTKLAKKDKIKKEYCVKLRTQKMLQFFSKSYSLTESFNSKIFWAIISGPQIQRKRNKNFMQ